MSGPMNAPGAGWRFRPFLFVGYGALVFLILGLGSWGVMARISGAVIASGQIEVLGNRQVVQHPTGGVVVEIAARDGDAVAAGDVLLRLDGEALTAELAIVEGQLFELVARQDRLEAERDGREEVAFSAEILERRATMPALDELVRAQETQFAARREALLNEQNQLDERAGQIANQIQGLEAQHAATAEQVGFVGEELRAQETLLAQGLTQTARVLTGRRDTAQLKGSLGQIEASIAENRARIVEIDIEKLKLESARREEAIAELREIEFREIELRARRGTLNEEISRLDIRAPVAGIVYNSTADTLRAVVRPAEPIMFIVPGDVDLIVRSRIEAALIDQVRPGQAAVLRFSAFDSRTTPDVNGTVTRVSADVFTDENTGQSFYRTDILLDAAARTALGERRLLPGMPVEAFIATEERTPLSYFVKPLADYFNRAFRER